MKTYNAKPGEIAREWYLVDAEGQTLGRLATAIAMATSYATGAGSMLRIVRVWSGTPIAHASYRRFAFRPSAERPTLFPARA